MQSKSFWQRPEGVTGGLLLLGLAAAAVVLLNKYLPLLVSLAENTAYLAAMLAALAGVVYVVLDPKTRNLVWFMYKSVVRWMTGLFVQIDPIGILKSYIQDLEKSLRTLSKQIGALRGQMRQLKGIMDGNATEIQKNMAIAERSKKQGDDKNLTLSTRKAGRLQDANAKYQALYGKMDVLYKVLTRMYEHSEIVLEDTKDQVTLKEQEYQAIKTSHSAIRSAQSVLSGSPDQRAMFDQALEQLADEVSQKVGDMERFMDTSRNLMDSIDLTNGVFEEEGLQLLQQWEIDGTVSKPAPASKAAEKPLDINTPPKQALKDEGGYHQLFD